MKLSIETQSTNVIRAYEHGRIVVNEESVTRSVVVLPEQVMRDWPPQEFEALEPDHLQQVVALGPEIILLGTGSTQRFPAQHILGPILQGRTGIEIMDTPAACRTFNLLSADGRNVAAALLMI